MYWTVFVLRAGKLIHFEVEANFAEDIYGRYCDSEFFETDDDYLGYLRKDAIELEQTRQSARANFIL